MSLKSFHVFFIVMAVLISFGFSAWAFTNGDGPLGGSATAAGTVTAILGVVIAVYGVWFVIKKSGRIIV